MKLPFFKTTMFAVLLAAVLCLIVRDNGAKAPVKTPEKSFLKEGQFGRKEIIRFGVYSNGVKMGSGELKFSGTKLMESRHLQQIQFKITSFRIVDSENILGTEDFMSPVTVLRDVKVFGKSETIKEDYARDSKSVTITKTAASGEVTSTTLNSGQVLNNVFLFIYKIRNDSDLGVGKVYNVNLPTQKFELIVKDMRKIRVPLGTFEVFYIISNPSKYKFWISTSENRIPLRIQGLASGGLVYLAATAVENPQ